MHVSEVPMVLDLVIEGLRNCQWDEESIEQVISEAGESLQAKSQVPVRIAVTGRRIGLPLYKPMAILDRSLALSRLVDARSKLA